MASFLEGQLAAAIAKGFKGKVLVGTLTRMVSTGVDANNDPIETPITFRVEGFCDEYSEAYRAAAGIPENSVKVVLIAGNCETDPKKNDFIQFPKYPRYQVRKIMGDPATAHWECESFT